MMGPRRPISLARTPSAAGSARTKSDELEEELLSTAAAATAASASVEKKRVMLAKESRGMWLWCGFWKEKEKKGGGKRRKKGEREVRRES
jgi:hypothetical protein